MSVTKKRYKPYSHEEVKNYMAKEGYTLLSQYKHANAKLTIKCPKGHIYKASWATFHNSGCRCAECKGKVPFDKIVKYIEDKGYKVLDKDWPDRSKKINTICPNGHHYNLNWTTFQNGTRCMECRKEETRQKFANLVSSSGYSLSFNPSIEKKLEGTIICDKGHSYYGTYSNFSLGHRCPICSKGISKPEIEIKEFINSLGIEGVSRSRKAIFPYEIDYYVPKYKVGFEYHGMYWHSKEIMMQYGEEENKAKNKHKIKADLADQNKIRLIQIFEDEWRDQKDICKRLISSAFKIKTEEKIFARKCIIKEVNFRDAKIFLQKNHIGGAGLVGSIRLGLYFKDYLVALLTFLDRKLSSRFKKKEGKFELYKYATSCRVTGGLSKLFNNFIKTYNPKEIFTYTDRRWFNGNSLKFLNFSLDKIIEPNYFYVHPQKWKRIHRFALRKTWKGGLTEKEQRLLEGYLSIYDAGHLKWIWKNPSY